MKTALQIGLAQKLTMTPQLQQAIRLLQLSALELQSEIQAQVDANPVLEYDNGPAYNDYLGYSDYCSPTTLQDHLISQLDLNHFSETDRILAIEIIGAINDDGFLDYPLEEILNNCLKNNTLDINIHHIKNVLNKIQQFDPIGVGARNLSECLNCQLSHLPADTPWLEPIKNLINHYLPLLAKGNHSALEQKLKVSNQTLKQMIHCLHSLNPKPGAQINTKPSEYIVPELFAYQKQNHWVIELNTQCLPKLRLNLHDRFLGYQRQEAHWFLNSLEKRNQTLLKVASSIINYQKDFFEIGSQAIKPLKLQDIAQAVGMHESTISRVTSHKYIHTPRGLYALKYFFSSALNTQQGKESSSTSIRALIKQFIRSENPLSPLSDNRLSYLLAQQGFQVARRTITKYREALGLLPSYQRKPLL